MHCGVIYIYRTISEPDMLLSGRHKFNGFACFIWNYIAKT